MPDLLQAVKKQFAKDLYATQTTGIDIEDVGEQYAKCVLHLDEKHRNAMGAVMGGVLYTLADFAFAVLSNQIHQLTVAQQVDIHYLSAPKGNKLIAKATCRKNGRTSSIVNVDISDDTGRDVAQFIGTGFKL